ncbi:MAG: hypothetical protein N2572_02805 [Syntrophales bacterium]|nr:hypothetical protein [Syntrophales bacterium]
MNRIIIQIYEVQDAQEAVRLIKEGVDHVGTVIPSPALELWPPLRETVKAVQLGGAKSCILPLFSEPADIFHALAYFQPDFIHLCETISTHTLNLLIDLQEEIKEKFPTVGIMRSIGLPRPGLAKRELSQDFKLIVDSFASCTDYFLLDTLKEGSQPVNGFIGITGEICDWSLARKFVEISPRPVILAGGLGPDNVAEAIKYVHPAGVDSCSRTNAVDERGRPLRFRKDIKLVSLFVREARRVEKLRRP